MQARRLGLASRGIVAIFALAAASACGGAPLPPAAPRVVDTTPPDRRAIDDVLQRLNEDDAAIAFDRAHDFLIQFPASPYRVTAHGVLAVVALGSDSPEAAREPLEAVIVESSDPLTLATAHYELAVLFESSEEVDALEHALAAHRFIERVPDAEAEWNETFVAIVPGALAASRRPEPGTAEGIVAIVDTNGFDDETRAAILRATSEIAFRHARWSLVLGLERAAGIPSDAGAAGCRALARLARAAGYGGGPLEPAELTATEACGRPAMLPIRVDTFELTAWVDALQDGAARCVTTARARRRSLVVDLALEATESAPRFAATGQAALDRCLARAIASAAVSEPHIERPSAFSSRSIGPLLSIPISDDP